VSTEEEKSKALAGRISEAPENGNLAVVDEMMAPDYVIHARLLPDREPGREGTIRAIAQISAVSNASVPSEDQVTAGDKVVSRQLWR
jgi:hypothetical protein